MNIFVTDYDPIKAAMNLDDKRIKHMPRECIEMLTCYIHSITNRWVVPFPFWGDDTRRTTESRELLYNHPCTKWVGRDKANAWWLYLHMNALFVENEYRFQELPRIAGYVNELAPYLSPIDRLPTSFRNSSLFKEDGMNVITAYRETMMVKWFKTDIKRPILWTKRGPPNWAKEKQSTLNL